MAKEVDAQAAFVGPMRFDVTSGTGHTITLDVLESDGGENSGPTPMELLLMSLAGCTGMDVVSILQKMRQQVTNYEIHVHGTRADEHPRVYEDVTVEHIVTGHRLDAASVKRAVELSETKYCSVSATVGKTAKITTAIRIVEAAAE